MNQTPLHTLHIEGHTLVARALNPGAPGEPLILMHGVTASFGYWQGGFAEPFTANGPCYSLTLPGHYPAVFPPRMPPTALTPEPLARLLDAAIRELIGERPATLVGYSTGGYSALALGVYAPQRVRRILCISGFAQGRWIGMLGLYQRLARSGAAGRALFKASYRLAGITPGIFRWSLRTFTANPRAFYATPGLAQMIASAYADYQCLDFDAMLVYFSQMPKVDLTPQLGRIHAPTLVLAGERDPIVPTEQARSIAAHIPGAELALLPETGHVPMGERAADYRRILQDWFTRTAQ